MEITTLNLCCEIIVNFDQFSNVIRRTFVSCELFICEVSILFLCKFSVF